MFIVYLGDVTEEKNIYQIGGQDKVDISGLPLEEMPLHPCDRRVFRECAARANETGESFHWFCRVKGKDGTIRGFQTVNIPQGDGKFLGLAWDVTEQPNDLMDSFYTQLHNSFWGAQQSPVKNFRGLSSGLSLQEDTLMVHFRTQGFADAFNKVSAHIIPLIGSKVEGIYELGLNRMPEIAG